MLQKLKKCYIEKAWFTAPTLRMLHQLIIILKRAPLQDDLNKKKDKSTGKIETIFCNW